MSKFDDFNLDIKGEGNGGNARSLTFDYWVCGTSVVTMASCADTECCPTGAACGGTDAGCSGDTNSVCRSYCGGACGRR